MTAPKILFSKQKIMGLLSILIGGFIFFFFSQGTGIKNISSFDLNLGDSYWSFPIINIETAIAAEIFGIICVLLGIVQVFYRLRKSIARWLPIATLVFFILGLLIWASAGKTMNVAGLLQSTIARSLPLLFGALCGVLSERSGVMYIGIEGTLLSGAFAGAIVGSLSANSWVGLVVGTLAGGLMAAIFALLVIRYRVDQVIAGMGINLLAQGITSFLVVRITDTQRFNTPPRFLPIDIPILSKIPVLGPIFFRHNIYLLLALVIVGLVYFGMYYTKWGLRVRAVGEHPRAADTLGVNVYKVRYINVILGGLVAGLGGTYFTLGSTGAFDKLMTAGRGFVGLAAMIFGGMHPLGALGASLVFGFSEAFQTRLALLNAVIPSDLLMMLPYLLTIIIVAGFVGRVRPPAADGKPYIME